VWLGDNDGVCVCVRFLGIRAGLQPPEPHGAQISPPLGAQVYRAHAGRCRQALSRAHTRARNGMRLGGRGLRLHAQPPVKVFGRGAGRPRGRSWIGGAPPRRWWCARPPMRLSSGPSTGAGGDHGIAKMWSRSEISVSSELWFIPLSSPAPAYMRPGREDCEDHCGRGCGEYDQLFIARARRRGGCRW
jgi:hypothetical protein